jgi:hypothetical protein
LTPGCAWLGAEPMKATRKTTVNQTARFLITLVPSHLVAVRQNSIDFTSVRPHRSGGSRPPCTAPARRLAAGTTVPQESCPCMIVLRLTKKGLNTGGPLATCQDLSRPCKNCRLYCSSLMAHCPSLSTRNAYRMTARVQGASTLVRDTSTQENPCGQTTDTLTVLLSGYAGPSVPRLDSRGAAKPLVRCSST